jgi:hypothetical protein
MNDFHDSITMQTATVDEFAEWLHDAGHLKTATTIDARRLAVQFFEHKHQQGRLPDDWRNHAHVEMLDADA